MGMSAVKLVMLTDWILTHLLFHVQASEVSFFIY